jgi:type IV secretory pathway VirB9-like protein
MYRIVIALTSAALLSFSSASAQGTRDVAYNERSVVRVNAKLRFTTLIILPDSEQILDFVCGDKDFWIVSGAQNLAYVKPAKAGASTNLNLVTSSGHVYSFLLAEGAAEPDLKLHIEPDETMVPSMSKTPRFYTAAQVDDFKRAAEDARKEVAGAKDAASKSVEEAVRTFRATYPMTLEFPYVLKGDRKPFNVVAIYHDDRFTYIKANASELPSLYEVKDGAPNLVNFQVEHGVYVVPKILDGGYLTIGEKKLAFDRVK